VSDSGAYIALQQEITSCCVADEARQSCYSAKLHFIAKDFTSGAEKAGLLIVVLVQEEPFSLLCVIVYKRAF